MNDANDNLILAAPLQTNSPNEYGGIKHIMNLFFEYFGECDILQENLLPAFNVDVTRFKLECFAERKLSVGSIAK